MTGEAPCRGLTWDHPRGYRALAAAASRLGGGVLRWDRQPLEGFESHPVGELARHYDLLVLDHPHIGEAVALDCLVALEELFAPELIAAWRERTVGRAMQSYQWTGRHWALPVDVATQVMASRADLLDAPPPRDWDEVLRLSEHGRVALAIAGPHAVLLLFAICAALGHAPQGEDLLPDAACAEAWAILSRLHARAVPGTAALNPIGLLEAMARGGDIALVPLVYGYVNYAVAGPGRHAIAFDEAPLARPGGRHGSVLGGTGIAVTRRARVTPPLLRHLAWLLSDEAQAGFIPEHEGQPSVRLAWQDARVNLRWGGFYRRTGATIADAILRPRHAGYIAFQTAAAELVRAGLREGADAASVLARLRTAWRGSLAGVDKGVSVQP